MHSTTKFSNVSKDIIDNHFSLVPERYNKLGLINISPDIKEFVCAKSHFAIIYNNITKEDEFHGTERSTSYYAMLFGGWVGCVGPLRRLYREGKSSPKREI